MRVLIVEDEPDLCSLLQKYLVRQGFEAEMAFSGEEAWKAVQLDPERFDAFLIDLSLPGISGDGLARKLLEAAPAAKILLSSGYAFDPAQLDASGRRVAFLKKPFMPTQLVEGLRTLTDR